MPRHWKESSTSYHKCKANLPLQSQYSTSIPIFNQTELLRNARISPTSVLLKMHSQPRMFILSCLANSYSFFKISSSKISSGTFSQALPPYSLYLPFPVSLPGSSSCVSVASCGHYSTYNYCFFYCVQLEWTPWR